MNIIKYVLIKNNQIIKFRNIKEDVLLIDKLLKHGYLPVIEMEVPAIEYTTISDSYDIQKDVVNHIFTAQDLPVDEAKKIKIENTVNAVVDGIREAFELGQTEQDTKINNILQKKNQKIVEIKAVKTVQELRGIEDIGRI